MSYMCSWSLLRNWPVNFIHLFALRCHARQTCHCLPEVSLWQKNVIAIHQPHLLIDGLVYLGIIMVKAKSKFVKVLLESIVTKHPVVLLRLRTTENLEVLRYDPWLQGPCLYREKKKIGSHTRWVLAQHSNLDAGNFSVLAGIGCAKVYQLHHVPLALWRTNQTGLTPTGGRANWPRVRVSGIWEIKNLAAKWWRKASGFWSIGKHDDIVIELN